MSVNTNLNRIKNKKTQSNNTSGCTGVSWHSGCGQWFARITFRGKTYNLGYYDTKGEAIAVRKKAESMTFDKFIESLNSAKTITIK